MSAANYYTFFVENNFDINRDDPSYFKKLCNNLIAESSDTKTKNVAGDLLQSLSHEPEKFSEILNGARVE